VEKEHADRAGTRSLGVGSRARVHLKTQLPGPFARGTSEFLREHVAQFAVDHDLRVGLLSQI